MCIDHSGATFLSKIGSLMPKSGWQTTSNNRNEIGTSLLCTVDDKMGLFHTWHTFLKQINVLFYFNIPLYFFSSYCEKPAYSLLLNTEDCTISKKGKLKIQELSHVFIENNYGHSLHSKIGKKKKKNQQKFGNFYHNQPQQCCGFNQWKLFQWEKTGKLRVPKSRDLFSPLSAFLELPFFILLCNSWHHLKSCRLYLRQRLPTWRESISIVWYICHYACLYISARCVRAHLARVVGSSRVIADGFLTSDKAYCRKLQWDDWWNWNLIIIEIWAFPPVSWRHTAYLLPCQGRQEAGKKRTEESVNQETRFAGHNWQPRVEQNQIL